MQMPEGDPHPSTLPRFKGRRDPEYSVTRSRFGRKKKRVEFEDFQPQDIPNPTEDNFPWRCITQLPDGVSHIYYTGKELTNRDSMRVYDTFTTVFKVWKDIATLTAVRDAVVNIFGQFMDIRLGNSDNRLIQALTEHWWPTTQTFLFPCAEIRVTPLDFTMLTSLSIGRYPTQVPYDDAWSILSNARQLLLNINSSHIKIVNDLDSAAQYDWGYAILASLYHGLDTAVTTGGAITGFVQLLLYWFYKYCGVGHPIVKEEVKYSVYPRLRAWERGNRWKTNDQAANLFIIGRYHIDHRTVETITWEPWFDFAVSETEVVLNAKLLSRKRIPLQVPNENCEYYLGDRCWRQVTGEVRIPLDPPLSMSPHISPATLHEMRQAGLSQDFSLPGKAERPDLGWDIKWTGRRENLPIARLRNPPPMSSSYGAEELWHLTHGTRRLIHVESAQDAQRIQEVEEELAISCRKIDSIDHQLWRGRDVRVVLLPPGGGARTRQRRSGPRTRKGSTSHRGRGTGDDSE
ncbi:hypothetical protein GIB67_012788 [Kingdonia uniflora]|uniref:Aminotransferase-like plant mobile domain-containing protein n=1 Tax=Kingdonia uniflora TaxID=39325 RepID=A0A7J7NF93_9MAGN|nr:hypothetical protein GIB67_012788 [Kingdonia uniflora]